MPSLEGPAFEVPQVTAFSQALNAALEHAQSVKPTSAIEPVLTKSDFEELFSLLPTIFPVSSSAAQSQSNDNSDAKRLRQFTVIESAARSLFGSLVATVSIDSPGFVQIWNLFDILAALADHDKCDPALLFWLVEELLESQTIDGCRKTFDYLESRRERIVAKHFKQKQLVILRACNELLRRLSRAEDTSFCGRVFIFMFQSFPLGDRSSVNLRGEYHTENVTTFEETSLKSDADADKMDVDAVADGSKESKDAKTAGTKAVSFDAKNRAAAEKDKPLDTDELYPVFWSLQQFFSQPLKLFDAQNLAKFKSGLEATVVAFETVEKTQKVSKSSDDTKDASKKRKRFEADAVDSSNFNPKYLTSKDLFDLEISDLFFRRHILIQAVITLDFMRSLNTTSKAKHASIQKQNLSVMYSDKTLVEEDDKWAETMRERIMTDILYTTDGNYVHRIIQAVTARDKGWARWKMEQCPPIERPSVTPAEFNEAKSSAKRLMTSKKLRPTPMGSLNLDFLKEEDPESALEKFKDPARYKLPELVTFKDKIADDDFEIGFAKSEKEKGQIVERKASKTWRALRVASRNRLAAFDKVDDWQNIEAIFHEPTDPDEVEGEQEEGETGRRPDDKRPIIVSGPSGAGKSTLVAMLLERQPGVFGTLLQHTTRQPAEGEVNGEDLHFVDLAAYNFMLDNDQFLECHNVNGVDYGTSRKMADSIIESGKVPLMQLDRESVKSVKDYEYSARILFVSPPGASDLETRLKASGRYTEEKIPDLLASAQQEIEESETGGLYDTVVLNEDLETAYKALEEFIYGSSEGTNGTNGVNGDAAHADEDVTMESAADGEAVEQQPESNGA